MKIEFVPALIRLPFEKIIKKTLLILFFFTSINFSV